MFHPTSVISPKANISSNVKIGPFCTVDEDVIIEKDCELISHVHITGKTKIGENNIFFPFSSIGTIPQDLKYSVELSELLIGNNNTFREGVTINPGTKNGGMITRIENNCLFMVGAHVAHDCHIYSNVILANNATLAGHVTIHNNAILGGLSAVHQFVSIGKYAMIGGMSGVGLNIIPYGLYIGVRTNLRGLNLIGLKRKKIKGKVIHKIQHSYNKIFNKINPIMQNIKNLSDEERDIVEVNEIIEFIENNIKRGICKT